MFRTSCLLMLLCLGLSASAIAQDIQRGTLKSLDLEQKKIVITSGGKDREFSLTDTTNVLGESGKNLSEKLKDFAAGTEIFFKPKSAESGELVGIKRVTARDNPAGAGRPGNSGRPVSSDTKSLKPLTELGTAKYQNFEGGFYPNGKNERPAEHEAAGLKLARQVQPLNASGKRDSNGKVVLLSVGMSNTSQSSQGFEAELRGSTKKHPQLQFVNGAQGGMTAAAIQSAADGRGATYWATVDQRLQQAGVTREQVQVVWIKQADAGPNSGFPKYAQTLQAELQLIVQLIAQRFPNCRLVYLSSRTYGGYATTMLNPEPYAYESGFSVKWLIESQISGSAELNFDAAKGPVKSPWLSWGPYLWANGSSPRADGFSYDVADFVADGTHQSPSGQRKVGMLMREFFESDSTTKSWFTKP